MDMIFRQARHMSTAQGNRPATRSLQQLPAEERAARDPAATPPFSAADENELYQEYVSPPANSQVMRDLLKESIGYYVITQHLVGTSELVVKQGLLIRVELNAFVLQDGYESFVVCDYYSLKFFRRMPVTQMPHNSEWSPTASSAAIMKNGEVWHSAE